MRNVMQNAFQPVNAKRILLFDMPVPMNKPSDRLREARERAGYATAKAAAERLAVRPPTYYGHENGSRGIKPAEAERYAKAFKVRAEWILYGTLGPERLTTDDDPQQPLAPIVQAIEDSLVGLTEAEQRLIVDVVRRQRALLRPEDQ